MATSKNFVLLTATLPLLALPAAAHHSFAAYDTSKTITVEATIKEFNWNAPHSTGVFIASAPAGHTSTITLVAGAPNMFTRQGFHSRDFKAGTKITLSYHPLRTGDVSGGSLVAMLLPEGRRFGDTESPDVAK